MRTILDRLPFLPMFEGEGGGAGGAGAATQAGGGAADTVAAGGAADTTKAGGGADTVRAGGANNAFNRDPDDKTSPTPGDFPADWREKFATGADGKPDPKVVERLKRYDSPTAFAKAGLEAQNRILSGKAGEDIPMPDEKADPDGAKKWREERGIPAEPSGYTIPDDIKPMFTEADAPLVANYTTFAHGKGMTPAQVQDNLRWYAQFAEEQAANVEAADKEAADEVEDALRKEWGNDFRDNKLMAKKFADESIPGVPWFKARLPNDPALGDMAGKTLGNIAGVVKAFTELGLLKFGDVSFAGGEAAKATEARMAELKRIMDTDIDKWNSMPAERAEYYKLLEASQKRQGAGA